MKQACSRVLAVAHQQAEEHNSSALAFVRIHAASCPKCTHIVTGAQQVLAQLQRAANEPIPAPPEDLVHRIMARLPEPSTRQRLWIAVGGSAAAASAATIFVAALVRLLPTASGQGLMPGLRGGLAATGAWLGRFAALFEAWGGLPLPGGGGGSMAGGASLLPPLLLIATGLLGLTAVITLAATRAARPVAPRQISQS